MRAYNYQIISLVVFLFCISCGPNEYLDTTSTWPNDTKKIVETYREDDSNRELIKRDFYTRSGLHFMSIDFLEDDTLKYYQLPSEYEGQSFDGTWKYVNRVNLIKDITYDEFYVGENRGLQDDREEFRSDLNSWWVEIDGNKFTQYADYKVNEIELFTKWNFIITKDNDDGLVLNLLNYSVKYDDNPEENFLIYNEELDERGRVIHYNSSSPSIRYRQLLLGTTAFIEMHDDSLFVYDLAMTYNLDNTRDLEHKFKLSNYKETIEPVILVRK